MTPRVGICLIVVSPTRSANVRRVVSRSGLGGGPRIGIGFGPGSILPMRCVSPAVRTAALRHVRRETGEASAQGFAGPRGARLSGERGRREGRKEGGGGRGRGGGGGWGPISTAGSPCRSTTFGGSRSRRTREPGPAGTHRRASGCPRRVGSLRRGLPRRWIERWSPTPPSRRYESPPSRGDRL